MWKVESNQNFFSPNTDIFIETEMDVCLVLGQSLMNITQTLNIIYKNSKSKMPGLERLSSDHSASAFNDPLTACFKNNINAIKCLKLLFYHDFNVLYMLFINNFSILLQLECFSTYLLLYCCQIILQYKSF